MGKSKKTMFKVFDYMHCDDFANYLERMAAKGWYFKEWGAGLVFEKGEAGKVSYAVEVFPKAKETDLRPEPNTREFAEYCEAAGWKMIDAKQKFCIFQKVDENAVDILTPEERVQNSWKSTFSGATISLLILCGWNMVLQFRNLFGPMFSYTIFSTMSFFGVFAWTTLFFNQLFKVLYAVRAKEKLLKKIKEGQDVYIGNNKGGKKIWSGHTFNTIVLMLICLFFIATLEDRALVVYCMILMVVTFSFSMILAKKRPDAVTYTAIQVVFTIVYIFLLLMIPFMIFSGKRESRENIENVPLLVSDYKVSADKIDDISISIEKNILGSKEHYWVHGEKSISYEIYRSSHPWILNRIWEEEMEKSKNESKTECSGDWEAYIAYRNAIGDYYVRYEDAILIFYEDVDTILEPGQISIILDKLQLR